MAGYQGLGRITDPSTQAVCKTLFDLVNALQRRVDALEAATLQGGTVVDADGRRITNVAPPMTLSDVVTAGYLQTQLDNLKGVSGTIDTATAQVVTVQRGIITEIA